MSVLVNAVATQPDFQGRVVILDNGQTWDTGRAPADPHTGPEPSLQAGPVRSNDAR